MGRYPILRTPDRHRGAHFPWDSLQNDQNPNTNMHNLFLLFFVWDRLSQSIFGKSSSENFENEEQCISTLLVLIPDTKIEYKISINKKVTLDCELRDNSVEESISELEKCRNEILEKSRNNVNSENLVSERDDFWNFLGKHGPFTIQC